MTSAADVILSVTTDDSLPIKKSCIVNRSHTVLLQCQLESEKPKNYLHKTKPNCHRNKITVFVDAENFLKLHAEPILLQKIKFFPAYLNATVKTKIPVIGFCDNFSVICVHDKNGYKFCDEWNGIYGKELVINFCEPNPLYCDEALLASKTTISYDFNKNGNAFTIHEPKKPIFGASMKKPYCVSDETDPGSLVYDLIQIMSMPPDNIQIQDSWGFRITKDANHPVLLEFMNHEKTLKQASPTFLMILLLKHHLKAIEEKNGEKPEKLGFCILDDYYGAEEEQRIKNGLEEVCEMLKIDYEFID